MTISARFLLFALAAAIFLIMVIRAVDMLVKRKTKYNFAFLMIAIILLSGTILEFVYPGSLRFVGSMAVAVSLVVIFIIALIVFLFYPQMRWFLSRRKMKNK